MTSGIEATDLRWYTVPNPPGFRPRPEWKRSIAVAPDGEIFVTTAVASSDEGAVTLCAAHDGVTVVVREGHVYVPASWMRREYPYAAETLDIVERKAPR